MKRRRRIEKSRTWCITLDPVVVTFDKPMSAEDLQELLDDRAHPLTLGSAGWNPVGRKRIVACEAIAFDELPRHPVCDDIGF